MFAALLVGYLVASAGVTMVMAAFLRQTRQREMMSLAVRSEHPREAAAGDDDWGQIAA